MPWKLVEFIWRRKHSGNYWAALMENLSEVSFTPSGGSDKGELASLLTQVFLDENEEQEETSSSESVLEMGEGWENDAWRLENEVRSKKRRIN